MKADGLRLLFQLTKRESFCQKQTFLAFFFDRFCVGDRFFLCDNKILCEYDYEERMVFANLAYNSGNLVNTNERNNRNGKS